jgi:hypothetical protein
MTDHQTGILIAPCTHTQSHHHFFSRSLSISGNVSPAPVRKSGSTLQLSQDGKIVPSTRRVASLRQSLVGGEGGATTTDDSSSALSRRTSLQHASHSGTTLDSSNVESVHLFTATHAEVMRCSLVVFLSHPTTMIFAADSSWCSGIVSISSTIATSFGN